MLRYLAKRHKNNLAAQKSRKIRRQREESITKTAEMLRAENDGLKSEIVQLREMIADLRKQLSSSCQAPSAPAETMRESRNVARDPYNPYHAFQLGFSINSQL
ncbi:unnamed protein product [Heligmosomoides polygyrus]|uniref:BZIP domain-containing protein n=1 Tax=Heligmosomoides polygyrus TaxID=6339 RepID=A0A183F2T1_HELPZ|nr:unnamed protein product [Heligmosomoides polygyrus]